MANKHHCTKRPFVVCHMLTSLDGKIDGGFMKAPENRRVAKMYDKLRDFYDCQAILYGSVTMAGGFAEGYALGLPVSEVEYPKEDFVGETDVNNYIVSLDPHGTLGWKSNHIQKRGREKAHVIVLLTEDVSNDYLAYLRSFDISYIFVGQHRIDFSCILEKLKSLFQIESLMIAGGGITNSSFLQENLIDELSLVISPIVDRSQTAASTFEKPDSLPRREPAVFSLIAAEKLDNNGLWLRYSLKPQD